MSQAFIGKNCASESSPHNPPFADGSIHFKGLDGVVFQKQLLAAATDQNGNFLDKFGNIITNESEKVFRDIGGQWTFSKSTFGENDPSLLKGIFNSKRYFASDYLVNKNFEIVRFGSPSNKDFGWFSSNWTNYKNNWIKTIKAVKAAGLKGIVFDFETYNKTKAYDETIRAWRDYFNDEARFPVFGHFQFEMPLLSRNQIPVVNVVNGAKAGDQNTAFKLTDGNYWSSAASSNAQGLFQYEINVGRRIPEGQPNAGQIEAAAIVNHVSIVWLNNHTKIASWKLEYQDPYDETSWTELASGINPPEKMTILDFGEGYRTKRIRITAKSNDYKVFGVYEVKAFGYYEDTPRYNFADYQKQAFLRGKELMDSVKEIFPEMEIIFTYAHGTVAVVNDYYEQPGWSLQEFHYGLVPAFIDGMMVGANPKTSFHDGFETSYRYVMDYDEQGEKLPDSWDREAKFQRVKNLFINARNSIKNAKKLSCTWSTPGDVMDPGCIPEELYSAKMKVSFGLHLDYKEVWSIEKKYRDPVTGRFTKNFHQPQDIKEIIQIATSLADQYVWIFSFNPDFVTGANLNDEYIREIRLARGGDADGDGFYDRDDLCPNDASKKSPGLCGCGTVDSDSDDDGVADCLDQCPLDPLKSEMGCCGCGVRDLDLNQNSIPDCKDPTKLPKPTKPKVTLDKKKKNVVVKMKSMAKAKYTLLFVKKKLVKIKKKTVVKLVKKTYTSRSKKFKISWKKLGSGKWSVSYKMNTPLGISSIKSPQSAKSNFKL